MKLLLQKLNFKWLPLLSIILLTSCSLDDDRKSVNMFLKKDGKNYMFSFMGTQMAKMSIEKNESPTVAKFTRIVENDGKLYIEPSQLENVVSLISGNYVIHDYEEKSFEGYVTKGKHDIFSSNNTTESTDNIGEMLTTFNINLTDIDKTKKHHISWRRNPDKIALENCIEMDLWVDRSYKPGARTIALEDFIMIELDEIVEFYNADVKLNYIEEEGNLYIIVN